MLRAVDAGVDLFVHQPYRSGLSAKALAQLKSSGIPVVPTTVVFDQLVSFYDGSLRFDELEKFVLDDDISQAYSDRTKVLVLDEAVNDWFKDVTRYQQIKFETVRSMHDAGVPLFLGSDSPNVGTVSGAALHQEISLWSTEAKLSSEVILSAGTGHSGQWLGQYLGWKVGQIKAGFDADLLLVNGDLQKDVTQSSNISAVWISGQPVTTPRY